MPIKLRYLLLVVFPLMLTASVGYQEPWGTDSSLSRKHSPKEEEKSLSGSTQLANTIISFHQNHFSPIDGPRSSFRPTSSRYMQLAMQRYGTCEGFLMGCDRLLRENADPWVYETIVIDHVTYKYDPAVKDKFSK